MMESWRWFGPLDAITLNEVAQTRVTGVVTALHEIPYGEVWSVDAIQNRKGLIEEDKAAGLVWNVAESLPLHEDIKRGTGDLNALFANYRQSLKNLSECGVKVVCYNFMPLLDWTRTQLDAPLTGGSTALRFSTVQMAAFEIYMLKRAGAEVDYSNSACAAAQGWFATSSEADRDVLLNSIMAGLPGAFERYSVAGLRNALQSYNGMTRADLRANYARFLSEIIPAAEDLDIRMCVHPDDPPRDILGLPRIVTSGDDIGWVLDRQKSMANGLTLCSGSLGAMPKNNVPEIAHRFASRIHFAHLRNVHNEADGSFQEATHLGGDTDMIALLQVLLAEEKRRQADGRTDAVIPFRADHGHMMLDDHTRAAHPGYPLIGRMCGLAELRGAITAINHAP